MTVCGPTFFRSKASGGVAFGTGAPAELTLAEAIHASTNAPVNYFDGPAVFPDNPNRYWDGAITGNNNPVLVGVTEAITTTKVFTEVVALSLGSATVALPQPLPGQENSPYVRQRSAEGLVNDLRKLATAVLDDPPDMATFIAHVMTGSGAGVIGTRVADSQIVRMNPLISPVLDASTRQWTAPGGLTLAQFQALAALDMDAIEQHDVESIADYADKWLADEVPNSRCVWMEIRWRLRSDRAPSAWHERRGTQLKTRADLVRRGWPKHVSFNHGYVCCGGYWVELLPVEDCFGADAPV